MKNALRNCYVAIGDQVFQPIIGIPMGSDPALFFTKKLKNSKKELKKESKINKNFLDLNIKIQNSRFHRKKFTINEPILILI